MSEQAEAVHYRSRRVLGFRRAAPADLVCDSDLPAGDSPRSGARRLPAA